jgi:hypothetical protein
MARTKTKANAASDPVIESTRAKPWLARQLPEYGPLIFWRDGSDETRDGIVCITTFCDNPDCPCHDALLDVLSVDDHHSAVEVTRDGEIRMPCMAESESELPPTRRAAVVVDLDTGTLTPAEGQQDEAVLAWVRSVMDKDVLDLLRRRASEMKQQVVAAPVRQATATPTPGRNDPCPCGSGRKFKHCCLGKQPTAGPAPEVAHELEDPLATAPAAGRDAPARTQRTTTGPRSKPTEPEVYQLKVTLLGIEPPIWRRIRVSANSTLGQLHDVLQIVMGWTNSHLHEYRVGEELVFGPPDPEREYPAGNELRTPLRQIAGPDSVIRYLYDFGDGWEHEIAVEQVLPAAEAGSAIPTCIDGQRRTPPEDCGGVGGYERLLEVLADPDADEHADMMKWVGKSFDPERFDQAAVDAKLRALAGLRGPARVRGRR